MYVTDLLVALSAVAVAAATWWGLNTWRKELKGKARFEVARSAMRSANKLKELFKGTRQPLLSSLEYAGRQRGEDEQPEVANILNEWYALNRRLEPLVEELCKLQEAGWEAKIVLGKEAEQHVSEAIKVFRDSDAELYAAIQTYFTMKRQIINNGPTESQKEELDRCRKIVYSAREDEFSKQIDKTVEQLESALEAYVK